MTSICCLMYQELGSNHTGSCVLSPQQNSIALFQGGSWYVTNRLRLCLSQSRLYQSHDHSRYARQSPYRQVIILAPSLADSACRHQDGLPSIRGLGKSCWLHRAGQWLN
jgi:hypothetical protein